MLDEQLYILLDCDELATAFMLGQHKKCIKELAKYPLEDSPIIHHYITEILSSKNEQAKLNQFIKLWYKLENIPNEHLYSYKFVRLLEELPVEDLCVYYSTCTPDKLPEIVDNLYSTIETTKSKYTGLRFLERVLEIQPQ